MTAVMNAVNMMTIMFMSMTPMECAEMKVSREQMVENRTRILNEASRLFREKGFDAVSVAEVMKAAGLTHGGFYGHFASKDDLIAETLAHTLNDAARGEFDFQEFLGSYLSPKHRDNPASGCPTAGLAADTRHQSPPARNVLSKGLRMQIERIGRALPSGADTERRRDAIGIWSAMVGAVILARSVDDAELSKDVLSQTRAWIEESIDRID